MSAQARLGNAYDAIKALVANEARRCGVALAEIRSAGGSTSVAAAVVWSLVAIGWGNGVVLAGRRFGHDQWITLFAVPLFGAAGAWWLHRRRGFRRSTIGLQPPRAAGVHPFVSGLTLVAALLAVGCAVVGLATNDGDMRGLSTIRTLIGTVFGEELIHRGVLLAVWANTGVSPGRVLAANVVTFGAWHVSGAICDGFDAGEVFLPAAGAVLFVWLRLRFRSILAPMAVHALNVFGVFKPFERCPYPFG